MNDQAHAIPTRFDFAGLIDWYVSHCDGDWEHQYGVRLETSDNPGWILTIDLADTNLDGREMLAIKEGTAVDGCSHEYESPDLSRWLHCSVRDNKFVGAGDPTQLARLFGEFEIFRKSCGEPS